MTIKTVDRPALTITGLLIHTLPMSPEIPALWPRFVARIPEIEDPLEPHVSYGVMRSAGARKEVLEYMAGISVRARGRVPAGMESILLPGGTYAVFSYPLSGLAKGFTEIFDRLMPASNHVQIPGAYLFERYDENFDAANPSSAVEIGVPVRAR
jgi:AraC family transcriptional regulator